VNFDRDYLNNINSTTP
jgi:ATP-binding cassette, subfamily A (ABC1), member 3